MNLLDLLKNSKLKINTANGNRPSTYGETVVRALNVKFPPNISPGGTFDSYIKVGSGGTLPIPVPTFPLNLTAENSDLLLTEGGDKIVTNQEQ